MEFPDFHTPIEVVPQMPEIATAFLIAGNILVLIFAFCGNSAALIVCWRSKFPRPSTKFYLISLASSDFVHAGLVTIASLGALTDKFHSWVLGEFMCTVSDFVQQCALFTNCSCLIAIAIDRYWAVVRGLKPPVMSPCLSKIISYIGMASIWMVPIAISGHTLTYYTHNSYWVYEWDGEKRVTDNITYYLCWKANYDKKFDMIYFIILGLFFAALLGVFLFSYISILVFVHRNFRHAPGDPHPTAPSIGTVEPRRAGNSPKRRNRRTAHVLATLMTIFLITRVPIWIYNIMIFTDQNTFGTTREVYLVIQSTLQLLSSLKSAINPFIYVIWNDALRSGGSGNSNGLGDSRGGGACSGCSSSLKGFSLRKLWRKLQGKSPMSYDFTGDNNNGTMPGTTTSTQKYFTSDNKNDTGAKISTTGPSYVINDY